MNSSTPKRPAWISRAALPVAWRTRLESLRQHSASRWRRLSVRERQLLTVLGATAALALVWLLFVQPAWRAIDRHATALPALRAQAAQVDALVQESVALQGQRSARIAPAAMADELAASLRQAALGGRFSVAPAGSAEAPAWNVHLDSVSASALMNWMSRMPALLRLTLTRADIGRAIGESGKALAGKASGVLELSGAAP